MRSTPNRSITEVPAMRGSRDDNECTVGSEYLLTRWVRMCAIRALLALMGVGFTACVAAAGTLQFVKSW
jgi:hypothetical protein